jgi:hypothetical protein
MRANFPDRPSGRVGVNNISRILAGIFFRISTHLQRHLFCHSRGVVMSPKNRSHHIAVAGREAGSQARFRNLSAAASVECLRSSEMLSLAAFTSPEAA